jgi:hypothetical protein
LDCQSKFYWACPIPFALVLWWVDLKSFFSHILEIARLLYIYYQRVPQNRADGLLAIHEDTDITMVQDGECHRLWLLSFLPAWQFFGIISFLFDSFI